MEGKSQETSAETKTIVHGDMVEVHVEGHHNNVTVIPPQVHKLSKDSQVVEHLKTITTPVSESHGITEQAFLYDGKA